VKLKLCNLVQVVVDEAKRALLNCWWLVYRAVNWSVKTKALIPLSHV